MIAKIQKLWQEILISFKFITALTLCFVIASFYSQKLNYFLPNYIEITVQKLQLWRLFTSFLLNGKDIVSFVYLLAVLYILIVISPDLVIILVIKERRFSTVYIISEYFIQTFIYNVVLIVISYPLIVTDTIYQTSATGFGLSPILVNFLWQIYSYYPNKKVGLCRKICEVQVKYLILIYLVISILVRMPIAANLIYISLGYYQNCRRKRSLFALPYSFYAFIEKLIPSFIKDSNSFIKVEHTSQYLKNVSACGFCDLGWVEQEQNRQAYKPETAQEVNNVNSYKNHWMNKDQSNDDNGVQMKKRKQKGGHHDLVEEN